MARTNAHTKNKTYLKHVIFLDLLDDFINDSFSGRRLKKNGKKIARSTIYNYEILKHTLLQFCKKRDFKLRIYVYDNLSASQRDSATKWYMKFYQKFTSYLYDDKELFDNYVGFNIKLLRAFFSYIENERDITFGPYVKYFHVPNEETPIIALTPTQLRYIIHSPEFHNKLSEKQKEVKDIFIFGCTVALRVSDLLRLNRSNLIIEGEDYLINVKSGKTNTRTLIKLPPYAKEIVIKYKDKYVTLLPPISNFWLNKLLKKFASHLPDNFEMPKIRERRGVPVVIYKDTKRKIHYHLSDHICSHTMRKTAITSMLMLGMSEHMVRQISGHAPNSKEFFRYVQLSQNYMNQETDKVFNRLCNWNPYNPEII